MPIQFKWGKFLCVDTLSDILEHNTYSGLNKLLAFLLESAHEEIDLSRIDIGHGKSYILHTFEIIQVIILAFLLNMQTLFVKTFTID